MDKETLDRQRRAEKPPVLEPGWLIEGETATPIRTHGPYSTCAECPHEHTATKCCHKTRILSQQSARDYSESHCCGRAPGSCPECPLIVKSAPHKACYCDKCLAPWRATHIDPANQPANPKQYYGDKKLPLYLVPFSTVAHLSVALFEGMRKYGLVNWRAAPVEAMTYASAAKRHIDKWISGQRADPETRVHHISSMMACGAIILDAEVNGTLVDNRPLPIDQAKIDAMVLELESVCDTLRQLHADKNPRHYTIADKPASV